MDEMEMWEVVVFYDNIKYSDSNMWETARLMCYFSAAPYMKDKTSISEFLPLPWDEVEEKRKDITTDEIKKLKMMAMSVKDKIGSE